MEKQTILDQVEIRPNGEIGVRFLKLPETTYHRITISPATDVEAAMQFMNAQLEQCDDAPCSDWSKLHSAVEACGGVSDGNATLVVNFNKQLLVRRGTFGSAVYDARCRGAFLADCPKGQALCDLVFAPELSA